MGLQHGSRRQPGAEALSGLARAFFYAGARALLVSHFYVMFGAASSLVAPFLLVDHAGEARLPIREAAAGQVKAR